ncbi:MAG TPA: SDR family oxidoreductase [Acidocella sp.]|jgi:gluconate 5-dehydrogenase|nr:MAG: gluconate 5-dehydrogenase [Acidocella sp. 20-58-15]HQT38458.1 SDR family oxidoreductase [Acidocella sp.]
MSQRLDYLFKLDGRHALITGGSSGIGLAIAEALGRQGAAVTLVARRIAELQAAASHLQGLGIDTKVIAADLMKRDGPDEVADVMKAPLDILVNAAGMNLRQPFESVTLEAFDDHMAIHLRAPFRLVQRLAPGMAERNYGRVIMIGSLQSYRAFPNSAPYGAAKGGVIQLTRAIAEQWSRHGITCNAIVPGFFRTGLTEAVFKDEAIAARNAAQTAIGRNGVMEDLYGTAIFLASQASAYVTGQILPVDGGFSAK